jgi:8-oxo-dGTP diphosphatase
VNAPVDAALLGDLIHAAGADGITKHVVGAVIPDAQGRVLLLHRTAGDYLGGLWELPSGGVDAGETLTEALHREVAEETGLTVTAIGAYLGHFDYWSKSGKKTRQFNFTATTQDSDSVKLTEHDARRWADRTQQQVSSAVPSVLATWRQEFVGSESYASNSPSLTPPTNARHSSRV